MDFEVNFRTQYCKDLTETFEKVALEDRILDHELETKPTEVEDYRDDYEGIYPYDERDDEETVARESSSVLSFPPKIIILRQGRSGATHTPPTIGYVQLRYDTHREALVPMLEIDSRSTTGRRITMMTPASFPPLARATSPTNSSGTISTLSAPEGKVTTDGDDSDKEPIVLGEELHLYLLHKSYDAQQFRTVSCSEAIQKMMRGQKGRWKRMQRRRKRQRVKQPHSGYERVSYRPMKSQK